MRHIILTTYVLKAPLMIGFSEQKHWQIACCEFITTSESCRWLREINYGKLRQLWLDHRALSLGTDHRESVPDSEDVTLGAITCHHFMMAAWHSNKSWTPVQVLFWPSGVSMSVGGQLTAQTQPEELRQRHDGKLSHCNTVSAQIFHSAHE